MAGYNIFNGFFSYAHYDANTDPSLIKDFTDRLEGRVGERLTNARFRVWRDERGLRTGERWNDKIEAELHRAHVLIVLLTPKWIESDYCRKEYCLFEGAEASRGIGEYVAPVLARAVEQQEKYFTPEQKDVYARMRTRQFFKATNFIKLSRAQRNTAIEEMADNIAGMIDRLRQLSTIPLSPPNRSRQTAGRGQTEFSALAEDYAEVDFVRLSGVRINRAQNDQTREIYAQVDFVERLFVKGRKAYVEFGVRHAVLSVAGAGPRQLHEVDDFHLQDVRRAAYVQLPDLPEAVSVAMYATQERGLAELSLPPTKGKSNYWSRIAIAAPELQSDQLRAELRVMLTPNDLHITGEVSRPLSQSAKRKIQAIIAAAIRKHEQFDQNGRIRRQVPIREGFHDS
jgi:hypothetical protein